MRKDGKFSLTSLAFIINFEGREAREAREIFFVYLLWSAENFVKLRIDILIFFLADPVRPPPPFEFLLKRNPPLENPGYAPE